MSDEALAERLPDSPDSTLHIGRPRRFQDLAQLHREIDAYFQSCDEAKKPYQMAGLARALAVSRQTLINYERYDDGAYVDAIKGARAKCEEYAVDLLMTPGSRVHPAGPIFVLKNCHGWKDENSVSVSVGVSIGIQADEAERRAMVPVVIVQQSAIPQPAESLDKVGYGHRIEPLSPPAELAPALSPELESAVTDVQTKAKATPARGVSPPKVV